MALNGTPFLPVRVHPLEFPFSHLPVLVIPAVVHAAFFGEALRRTLLHAVLADLPGRLRESSVEKGAPDIRLELVVVNLAQEHRGRPRRVFLCGQRLRHHHHEES